MSVIPLRVVLPIVARHAKVMRDQEVITADVLRAFELRAIVIHHGLLALFFGLNLQERIRYSASRV